MDFFKTLLVIFSSGNPEEILTQVVVKANEKQLKRAAKFGWVVPLELPYPTYKEFISDESHTKSDFDEYFTNYYEENFELNIKSPLLEYIDSVGSNLRELIIQSITCYEQGLYGICVPALFSILEGILAEFSNKGDRKKIRYREGLDDSVANDSLGLNVVNLVSISWFLDFAFAKSDFNQAEFKELNRHWMQHGRYNESLEKSSVLQLFSAVALALYAYDKSNK